MPVWLREKIKAGAKLEDFAVNKKRRLRARRESNAAAAGARNADGSIYRGASTESRAL
jgi:hypothetical protein